MIGLLFLFCLPLLSILFLKTKRNNLARPVMGTIFLVIIGWEHIAWGQVQIRRGQTLCPAIIEIDTVVLAFCAKKSSHSMIFSANYQKVSRDFWSNIMVVISQMIAACAEPIARKLSNIVLILNLSLCWKKSIHKTTDSITWICMYPRWASTNCSSRIIVPSQEKMSMFGEVLNKQGNVSLCEPYYQAIYR